MPDAPSWSDLDAALDRALDLDGAEREAFVASLDEPMRAALAPMLRNALRDDTVLDAPGAVFSLLAEASPAPPPSPQGERVGPYEIESLIGEGGMGRVYRARRADGAFEQTVAVKVVRTSLALAGSDVADRLRRERALLAALDHPGIARLLDGGETDDGVPYLVTEFVDGEPITEWADAHDLGVRDRVRLLVDVARAVDHAHRRFVVHRDLKPSNVLVAERDGPRPVVLDFGIAKVVEAAGDPGPFPRTRTGLRLLTPAYAAPELFEPTATVTTAADVYGLGALLYELLTGRRPHDDADRPAPPSTEPTRPSRIVTTGSGAAEGAQPTGGVVDPARRSRALRGDLDTICLKALHPDPARRYASAADLADDLGRYLDGRPVEARPDSLAYVAGRFVRRHRATVAAGAVALAALVVGFGVAVVSLADEREARAEAEAAATRATEAAGLLAGLFQTANPDYADGRAVTVAEAVAEGVGRVRAVEDDSLRAYLLRVLGETYIQLGEPVIADSLLQEALMVHGADAVGAEPSRVRGRLLATRDALSDPAGVIALARRLHADHPDDAEAVALALRWTSRAHSDLGQHDQAVEAARRLWASARGGTPEQRTLASGQLGEALAGADRPDEAVPYLEEAARMSRAAFGRSGRTSRALTMLGRARGQAGDVEGAEAALRAAIAFHAERYGAERVGYPLAYLGEVKLWSGQFIEAAAALDSAITMTAPILAGSHQDIGGWYALRAEACNGAGKYESAEAAARAALAIADALPPAVLPVARARALVQLGRAVDGRGGDGRPHLQEALTLFDTAAARPFVRADEVEGAVAALGVPPTRGVSAGGLHASSPAGR